MSAVLPDALGEIFTRLPIDSVLRCRSVCKAWLRVIDGESFLKFYTQNNHYSRSSTLLIRDSKGGCLYSLSLDSLILSDDATTEIDVTPIKQLIKRGVPFLRALPAPTCHGLILISNYRTEVIWNPMTRDIHRLPTPDACTPRHSLVSTGFGYDHTTDDYKVVKSYQYYECIRPPKIVRRTLVYSLKSRRWRRTAKDYACDFTLECEGVYLNGRLHFNTRHKHGIVVFDLATEDYRTLPPCDLLVGSVGYICVLDGRLLYSSYDYSLKRQKVWVMRDYGVEEGSWVELLDIGRVELPNTVNARSEYLNPVAYMESQALIFLQRSMDGALLCVDIENKSAKRMFKVDGLSNCTAFQFSPGTLFRLCNSNGRVNRKRKRKTNTNTKETDQKRLRFCVVESVYKVNS